MDTPPSEPARSLWLLPLLLTCVAASLITAFWFALKPNFENGQKNDTPPAVVAKMSRADSLKLLELRNQAIGFLENHEFSNAETTLSEIGRFLPADPFVTRNLAICQQLALDAADKQQFQKFSEIAALAKESVGRAKAGEPSSFIPWVISARVAIKSELTDLAMAELREAIRMAPEAVGPPYDLFVLLQSAPADKLSDEGVNALRSVYQKEPQNLFVLKDWLPLLAVRQDAAISETLKQAQVTITPFAEMIKVHSRVDLKQIIETAQVDVADNKWPKVQRSMTILKNVIVSESARDKRFVMLDSLEYVLPDFSQESLSRLDLPTSEESKSNPVHFLAPDDVSKWPKSQGCTDIAVTDFDLDGQPDIVAMNQKEVAVWGRKTTDQPWTTIASAETTEGYTGLLAYDFDDDVDQELKGILSSASVDDKVKSQANPDGTCHAADPDVILFGSAGLKLFENSKDTTSKSRTLIAKSGGAEFDATRDVIAAAVADLDSDGDLDLVISTGGGIRIFSNRGNLTFEDTTARSQLPPADLRVAALAIVDWDKDSDIDVIIATPSGGGVLENVRHGQVRYRVLPDFSLLNSATSLRIGDFDGNASWDVVAAGPKGVHVVLTNRTSAGNVTVRKLASLGQSQAGKIETGDFNNDGYLDVAVVTEERTEFLQLDQQQLVLNSNGQPAIDVVMKSTVFSVADLDRDGDLDLVSNDNDAIVCRSNQCRETDNPDNGWLEFQLVGERIRPGEQNWDKRVNHTNLGGMLEVKAGAQYQERVVAGPVTHFGLGKHRNAELARILWTNGIPSNVMAPSGHESLCIEQKLVGSCPYLYAWNGERFQFVTDLLWNAPLGLKFAETIVAPWREWEYLKIDGDQLKPVNNEYQLRITAELWEAEYFDQIKLFAVDHPAETEIYTNEKVGPAAIAEPKIHTVRVPQKPIAARDSHGRDILGQVIARDGNYTKTFDMRIAQGLTEEHFLELDLGEFPSSKNITLFLTGWMYPGSTSLSVQFSQNPEMPKPRPPALYAVDGSGEWREVRPFMGFPGGKTKTIAVDLSDVFVSNDHRLRIVSTMEIYWDSAFFTVDDPQVDVRQTELKMVSAELVDRGGVSSRSWPTSGNGPDQFDYKSLVPGERWPAMYGKFTRFGDVLPLLTTRDDQLVVTGSGDEIRLAFAESAVPLPTGWVRDFVIYSVGWDKDADPNTVYGNTVEPLPFESMTVYAHRDGESRPQDVEYVKYLREYQTRTRNPMKFWKSVQQFSGNAQ